MKSNKNARRTNEPAVTVVSTTTMSADNDGDDEHSGALSATNDVKPTVDADYNASPQ